MRVVVVEDELILQDAVAMALPLLQIEVVGRAGDEETGLRVIEETRPDVALLDIRLPPTHRDEGLRIAEAVRARHPEVGLLILSARAELAYAQRLLNVEPHARAVGYVHKEQVSDLKELAGTLHRVAAGEVVVDPRIVERLLRRQRSHDPLDRLTPSERRVLGLMAQGHSNAGIADVLGQRLTTVEKYVSTITAKLDLPSRQDPERRSSNVRVLAVLAFLRGGGPGAPTP